ncbi:MAG: PLP-dependent aminotransferase family protein [Cyanothece sp. SIO1E1]|nr:PLP-dependent aminotransferase family protein [Cyanothece sp. SIO1E1]
MDLAITLDNHAGLPLHRQLYTELRHAILQGRLPPRQRLPSTRALAKSLGISRTTVTQSYDQLLSEGYLQTVVGAGTFVCDQLPDYLLSSQPVELAQPTTCSAIPLSHYGASLATLDRSGLREPEAPISFRYGRPALNEFPLQLWRKLLSRHCRTTNWLGYATDPLGHPPLREAIAHYLARARAVDCDASQVMIVNGAQQALYLITRLLINPGEAIALEDPGYPSARQIFQSQEATLVPIAVDEAGLMVQDLANYPNTSIKLAYITPSHQFPTGAVLSLPRRLELLAWAQQHEALILEDDYDSEYRYDARPIPSLQGLDQSHSVLYMGTFSKMLFPALRIGYLVLPPHLVPTFTYARRLSDRQSSLLEQHVLTDFIQDGHLERHTRRMRTHYDRRRQVLVKALKTHLGTRATILGENAGIHLMVRLHTNLSDTEISQRAAKVGLGVVSAQPHYLGSHRAGEFILGYAELTENQIQTGIYKLAQVLQA